MWNGFSASSKQYSEAFQVELRAGLQVKYVQFQIISVIYGDVMEIGLKLGGVFFAAWNQ